MRKALYLISGLLGVLGMCLPVFTIEAQGLRPSPQDVKAVRRAYMILSTLNRIDRYERTYSLTESREAARRADSLTFRFRPLRNGPIAEILNARLYSLVSPRGGEVLEVIRETHQMNDDPITFVTYGADWKTELQPAPDTRTVLEILGASISESRYDRYVQYEITVRDGPKSREYQGMALFSGSLEEGMSGNMSLIDLIVDGYPLGLALAETLPPLRVPFFEFAESDQYREMVERARRGQSVTKISLQSLVRRVSFSPSAIPPSPRDPYSCPLGYEPDPWGCCNETTMHCCFPYEWTGICGVSRSEAYCTCSGSGGGVGEGTGGGAPPPSCTPRDDWAQPAYQDWSDLQYHNTTLVGNQHSGWMQSQGHCKKTSDCKMQGEVIKYGTPSHDRFDSQNTTDGRCHKIGMAGSAKVCSALRGGECTASRAVGYAVRACPDCSCSVSTSISYNGAGWTVAANDTFFSWVLQNDMVCVN